MRLNPAAFNAHLNNLGQSVDWYASTACPCVDIHSGAAKPGCPLCAGKGMIYSAPVRCIVGVASQKVIKAWAALGQYEQGDAILILGGGSPAYDAGRWDKFVLVNGDDRFSKAMIRGRNDRLHEPVKTVSRVFWLTPDGTAVVEGGLPAVASDGTLTWAAGEPPAGTQYSITGTRYPTYYVYDNMPSDRPEHGGARLPKNLVARRWDVMSR